METHLVLIILIIVTIAGAVLWFDLCYGRQDAVRVGVDVRQAVDLRQMQYIGRVFDDRTRFAADFTSPVFSNRTDATAACFKARPKAHRCMVSEARYNGDLKKTVPTHYGIQWIDRPVPGPAVPWWRRWTATAAVDSTR